MSDVPDARLLEQFARNGSEEAFAALVQRHFQNQSMAEVGKFLGLEGNTAQKRVSRALEKLRTFFTKRGVSSTTAIIAETISAHSVQAAPVALAKSITAVAIAKGAVTASTLTLVKGALKIMAWTKMKAAVVAGTVLIISAGTTTVAVKAVHSARVARYPNIQGAWEGTVEAAQAKLRVVFNVVKTNGAYRATTDSPDQGVTNAPVTKVAYDYPAVRFEVKPIGGTFVGSLDTDTV